MCMPYISDGFPPAGWFINAVNLEPVAPDAAPDM